MGRDDNTLTYNLTGSHEYRVSPDGTLSLSHPTERFTRVYESARRILETLVDIAREPSSIFTILYSKGNREERRQRQIEERHRRGTHGINK